MVRKLHIQHFVMVAFVVLAALSATTPRAMAKSRHQKAPQPAVAVVGHLALPGPAVQIFAQEHGRRHYVLIEQASKEGFIIVDVTKPSQPTIVKQVAWPNGASNGHLQPVKTGVFVSTAAENNTATAGNPAETLNLLDLSDPANPRMIQGFTGVTATLSDESRNLMYIANAAGLWIVEYKQEQPVTRGDGCPADGVSTDPVCSN